MDPKTNHQCAECASFADKNIATGYCCNEHAASYGLLVERTFHCQDYAYLYCNAKNLLFDKLSDCVTCRQPCARYRVYKALLRRCHSKGEWLKKSLKFKCTSKQDDFTTYLSCSKCKKNGCSVCNAAVDIENLAFNRITVSSLIDMYASVDSIIKP